MTPSLPLSISLASQYTARVCRQIDLQLAVVSAPTQSSLDQSQIVPLDDRLDHGKCIKGGFFEVAFALHTASAAGLIAVPAFCRYIIELVLAREDTACDRIVYDDLEAIFLASRNEFGFDGSGNGIIHAYGDYQHHVMAIVGRPD